MALVFPASLPAPLDLDRLLTLSPRDRLLALVYLLGRAFLPLPVHPDRPWGLFLRDRLLGQENPVHHDPLPFR
ncbi:hypothetical protein [Synechocystis salina]|uniref:hypothetical protein n=1 Tax=Synechocystis salina TaxID=945780 RepID=UPI001D139E1D|nr:hypothetical protein [Synechocystis salina]